MTLKKKIEAGKLRPTKKLFVAGDPTDPKHSPPPLFLGELNTLLLILDNFCLNA
jgi:hypothetical protein